LGLILAGIWGCKENLSPPPVSTGMDTSGPLVLLAPGQDTTVDSIGVLMVTVDVSDPSGIKQLEFLLVPPAFGFPTQQPNDTTAVVGYPLQLGQFKHSTFRFYVRATDILDHETVTDTVTVTVR